MPQPNAVEYDVNDMCFAKIGGKYQPFYIQLNNSFLECKGEQIFHVDGEALTCATAYLGDNEYVDVALLADGRVLVVTSDAYCIYQDRKHWETTVGQGVKNVVLYQFNDSPASAVSDFVEYLNNFIEEEVERGSLLCDAASYDSLIVAKAAFMGGAR